MRLMPTYFPSSKDTRMLCCPSKPEKPMGLASFERYWARLRLIGRQHTSLQQFDLFSGRCLAIKVKVGQRLSKHYADHLVCSRCGCTTNSAVR
jgi:hypothetical protein